MRHGATRDEVEKVVSVIEEMGYKARPMPGAQRTAVGLVGNDGRVDASRLEGLPGVQDVIHVSKPYKQVSREWKSTRLNSSHLVISYAVFCLKKKNTPFH